MAGEPKIGKKATETSSSSSSTASSAPLVLRRRQLVIRENLPPQSLSSHTSTEASAPKKAINILRSESPEYRKMGRGKLLEFLMDRPNPDAGKSVVVDIESEDEFNKALDETQKKELPLKKRMWYWKADNYSRSDPEFRKVPVRTHQSVSFGVKNPDELKSLASLEWSHYMVETYKIRVPEGWMVSIPTDLERVCLYSNNRMAIYPDAFQFGMRTPFNPFIKDIFNHFYIAPSQITPNSWRILRAFEAMCCHLQCRPTAKAFNYFFCIKRGGSDWAYFSKRSDFDSLRLMGGLTDSVPDWKEYFWKVTINPTETSFDFNSSWSKPIHKGEVPYKLLGLNDKATVTKIAKFVPEYLKKYGAEKDGAVKDEIDAEEVVRRYLNDDFVFELPEVVTQPGSDVSSCNQNRAHTHSTPPRKPCRIVDH